METSRNNLVLNSLSPRDNILSTINNVIVHDNFSEVQNLNIFNNLLISNYKKIINVDNKSILCDKLRYWILQFKLSYNAINALLTILRSEGIDIPKDVHTLMNTPKIKEITSITNSSYIHLGLKNMLLPFLEANNANIHVTNNILNMGINIDGLPISRSSKSQLWPILISILNFKKLSNNVIPIGIFHGYKKPHFIEEFFNPFINDVLEVLKNGLNVNGTMMNINISHIVWDAPAKSFLLNVKNFNAYFGCTSCIEEGDYLERGFV